MSRRTFSSSVELAVLRNESNLGKGGKSRPQPPRWDAHDTLLDLRGPLAALAVAAAIREMNRPIRWRS